MAVPEYIEKIKYFPTQLERVVKDLSEKELDQRAKTWSIRQVVHHLADSHLNSYIRIKMALTEENLTMKPYDETAWAELIDYKEPIHDSLALLNAVHKKITLVIDHMKEENWSITIRHPEHGELSLTEYIRIFAVHGEGHLKYIKESLS